MATGLRVTTKRIGKVKTAPDWGSATVNEIMRVLSEDSNLRAAPKAIVANWDNQPKFKTVTALNAGRRGAITISYKVFGTLLARNIWKWLNYGTRPHKIRAKNAKSLAFNWGGPGSYNAKTTPGGATLQFGGPGTVSGGTMRYPQEVDHPGSKARRFDLVIIAKFVPTYAKRIARGIGRIFK